MATRIKESLVKSLSAPAKGNKITYDTDLKGFGIRVTAAGAMAFVLNYRISGQERRFTIGGYPEWSATAARKEAEALKRKIDVGDDPMASRLEDRSGATIADLCSLYVDRHLPRKRPTSQRNDRAIIEKHVLPRLGKRKAASVRYGDIEALHREISARAPYQANRTLALLSRIFSLGIKWEMMQENPAKQVERNPEQPRTRYLDRAELDRLWLALAAHPNQSIANAIRLLLLTGARRGEVLQSSWDQFDLENGYWIKPASAVKQARAHRLPLSGAAVHLLRHMREDDPAGRLLFPGRSAKQPLADIKKAWAAICRRAELAGVRIHDLRHTYASHLVSAGNSLPIIGALLGHTQTQTTQRYAHLLDDPLRTATEAFGSLFRTEPVRELRE